MKHRIDYSAVLPEAMKPLYALHRYSEQSGLEQSLLELVRLRASQINGCAYCVDMHSKDARSKGESEQRLYALSVWRETPSYSERERAALAFTEAVTLIANQHVSDEVYAAAREQFSDAELVKLMMAITMINTWNRFAITFGDVAGSYQPEHFATQSGRSAMVASNE